MSAVFARPDPLGEFVVCPVNPVADLELLHRWLTHPKSAFWLMQNAARADVEREFREIAAAADRAAFLGLYRGTPAFLVERYDPAKSELAGVYRPQPGDVGMHFLVAPTTRPVTGFTRAVIVTIMEMLFSELSTSRVVVEPDVHNTAVQELNAYVGFRIIDTVPLADKNAFLSVCTRDDYLIAREGAHNGAHNGVLR